MLWKELARLDNAALGRWDVAHIQIACAEGLPGAEGMNIPLCLAALDEMKKRVEWKTLRQMAQYDRDPAAYPSRNQFRMLVLVSVLQREFGVRYNPAIIPVDVPLQTADSFLFGIIQGDGGSCASLPVLYTAVGRRLGYPLKLVESLVIRNAEIWGHSFVRWDEPAERFNVEATCTGYISESDDFYRTDTFQVESVLAHKCCLLQSKTAREELSGFLVERACWWRDFKNYRQAADAAAWAVALAPNNLLPLHVLERIMNLWHRELLAKVPPRFPELHIIFPPRRYPDTLKREYEHHMIHLETMENLLDDARNREKWWEPMKRQAPMAAKPSRIHVRYTATGSNVEVQLTPTGDSLHV